MGWHNIKEGYGIEHIVSVTKQGICIGSAYIHDLIIISPTGEVRKRFDDKSNEKLRRVQQAMDADPEKLRRVQQAMDADPEKLRRLATTRDTFAKTVTVWTYLDGEVIGLPCEEPGWPNCTHDGALMYDNMFFLTREEAALAAKEDMQAGISLARRRIREAEETIAEARKEIAVETARMAKLDAEFSSVVLNPEDER